MAAGALAACGPDADGEAPASSAEAADGFDAGALLAEIEADPPAEPVIAAAASPEDWVEVDLEPGVYREGAAPEGAERISIPVPAFSALEFKLAMKEGDAIAYRWTAEGLTDPERLQSEFHGHTERVGDAPGSVMFYRRGSGASESGELTAPFDGVHGWYLNNTTLDDIVIQLDLAGDYEIVPGQL